MKRHRRIGVVLGMVRHVPGEPTHQAVGGGRAGVLEGIRRVAAASVLGIEIEPEEGLADQER